MSTLLIVAIILAGILLAFTLLAALLLRIALVRKPAIDIAHDKIIRKTEWGEFIPLLVKGAEYFTTIEKERICRVSHDNLKLVAYFIPCKNEPESKKFALLMHGYYSCGKNDFGVGIEYFHEMGYNLLIPDQRAHGESEGKYIGFGVLERYDCKMWAEYLTQRFGGDIKILLGGISMGAATVLMASGLGLPDTVKCIYADSGFTAPIDELRHVIRRILHLPSAPFIWAAGIVSRRFAGYDITDCSTVDIVKNSSKPVLFIHGKADKLVPCEFSNKNYNACTGDKMLLLVENANHGTGFFVENEAYKAKMQEFLSKYLI